MKHLNPRQGITTVLPTILRCVPRRTQRCETPKSPPGDYNWAQQPHAHIPHHPRCETPKSPPGDYNNTASYARYVYGMPQARVRVKHLNPRQGITTRVVPAPLPASLVSCETPKSPPGDYNSTSSRPTDRGGMMCETPKSPPGDYNDASITPTPAEPRTMRVKHLNPRQGITTDAHQFLAVNAFDFECETPKSPPGDYNSASSGVNAAASTSSVKHLNPRQGITTSYYLPFLCSRHPAQCPYRCETPKSPPGDYN